jgi:phosphatidylglycerophosphatase A
MKILARRLAVLVGTGFYSGYFPIAPGTVGSVVWVVFYAALVRLGVAWSAWSTGWLCALAAVFVVGFLAAWHLEQRFGRDNKRIVIDEIWGMMISLALLPQSPGYLIGGFLLFRCFDIVKPFPARRAERIGGGLGVMLDDGIVGVYANLALRLARVLLG